MTSLRAALTLGAASLGCGPEVASQIPPIHDVGPAVEVASVDEGQILVTGSTDGGAVATWSTLPGDQVLTLQRLDPQARPVGEPIGLGTTADCSGMGSCLRHLFAHRGAYWLATNVEGDCWVVHDDDEVTREPCGIGLSLDDGILFRTWDDGLRWRPDEGDERLVPTDYRLAGLSEPVDAEPGCTIAASDGALLDVVRRYEASRGDFFLTAWVLPRGGAGPVEVAPTPFGGPSQRGREAPFGWSCGASCWVVVQPSLPDGPGELSVVRFAMGRLDISTRTLEDVVLTADPAVFSGKLVQRFASLAPDGVASNGLDLVVSTSSNTALWSAELEGGEIFVLDGGRVHHLAERRFWLEQQEIVGDFGARATIRVLELGD